MRKFMIAIAALAAVPMFATSASAQTYGRGGYYGGGSSHEVRREQRECDRELRHARSRWEYRREMAECRREIAQARREARRDRWDDRRDWQRGRHYGDRYDRRW